MQLIYLNYFILKMNPEFEKSVLKKIKSKYILLKILQNLKLNSKLKLIKYNKKIKNILDINIYDYKKYSEIELEIIPKKNGFGEFINISPVKINRLQKFIYKNK